jgi:hypothetical protein
MADWRRLAKAALLAGGRIDDQKVAILRKELFADKRIDRSELQFMMEARHGVYQAVPAFHALFMEVIRSVLLADGVISAEETAWLRAWLCRDGKFDAEGKKLIKELKLLADQVSPEFQALHDECMAS